MDYFDFYKNCMLCPRNCGVDRQRESGQKAGGFCGQTSGLRVSYIGPHFGEEPPISGTRGSGTIFFSGCSLRCSFCQNYQISREGAGRVISQEEFYQEVSRMIDEKGVHNINFVTPDHFFPHVFNLVQMLRENSCTIPMLYNVSGYQSIEMLKIAEDYADIYLPDFKYSDSKLASGLSRCADYPRIAIEAVFEMVSQKGFLETGEKEQETAEKGVLVRHLILPGNTNNSTGALDMLYSEFGPRLPLSLMSQYYPVLKHKDSNLNRKITNGEFERVYNRALDLGFENLFVQFPETRSQGEAESPAFLPDFEKEKPFRKTSGR